MATQTDDAVCIRRWDFSETSQTVSLFLREHGVVRAIAKGAKREKGAFSGGIDVLTRGQAVAVIKPGKDLATLTAWNVHETYPFIRTHLAANRAALYMADLVHHLIIDHDPHARAYDRLVDSLDSLRNTEFIERTLLTWQWLMLAEAGYKPQVQRDAVTGKDLPANAKAFSFSANDGGVIIDSSIGRQWKVRRETIEVLQLLDTTRSIEKKGDESVKRANRLLAVYVCEIISRELPTLRWAFPDLKLRRSVSA